MNSFKCLLYDVKIVSKNSFLAQHHQHINANFDFTLLKIMENYYWLMR